MVPRKLEAPLSSDMQPRLITLPMASSPRPNGVTSSVAMEPRSFSPAMDSGATAMQPLNRNTIIKSGSMEEKICPAVSRSEARSASTPRFTSNLLTSELS